MFFTLYIFLSKAKSVIAEKKGKLLEIIPGNNKDYLEIQCNRNHLFKMDIHKLTESHAHWCQKYWQEDKAKETREKTYNDTVEYLTNLNSYLLEKSYDYEKQKFHVFCNVHNGTWNEVGYEATRILREKIICPVCHNLQKQKEREQKLIEEQKQKENLRLQKEKERELRRIQKELDRQKLKNEKMQPKIIPPLPEGMDSFEHFSKFEDNYNYTDGREPRTLNRAKAELINQGVHENTIFAISIVNIKFKCPKCNKEHVKHINAILNKNFSVCPICGRKEALRKSHETRMNNEFNKMQKAAELQDIRPLSTKIEDAKKGIECIAPNGKKFWITYRQFKCRKGNMNPFIAKGGTSIPEIICRTVIEQLTGKKFPKGYPVGWSYPVKNQKPKTFSVDMYNATDFAQPIAIEYHGNNVHYEAKKDSSFYTKEKVKQTQKNDRKKAEYASATNTKFIIIRGYEKYVPLNQIISDLKKILDENEIPYNPDVKITISDDIFPISYKKKVENYCNKHSPSGTLITETICNVNQKVEIKCNKHNHIFKTSPLKLLYSNHWNCEHCISEKSRERNLLTEEDINERLSKIPYPFKITFLGFCDIRSVHAFGKWLCSEHGTLEKRLDSVLYLNYGKYHGCPECQKIMYSKLQPR